MNEELIKRKEKLLKVFNKQWFQYLILLFIIGIGWIIRKQPISKLIDATTGKFISIELDSTLYLRYAEYIAEHGKLFAIDTLRYSPFGANVDITVFSSYFVAYLYRVLKFLNFDVSIGLVNNYYPLIATAILSVFLFLFVRRAFDWRVGLLSVLFLNIIPSFLFRSMGGSTDHDILALMFLVMTFYFYLLALQSKKFKFNILFGAIAALTAGLGMLTAGSINFFFMTASVFVLVEIIFNKFNKTDLTVLGSFLIIFTILIVGMGRTSFLGLITSFTTGFLYFGLIAGLFYLYIYPSKKFNSFLARISYLKNFPAGIFSLILCAIIVFLFSLIFFGSNFILDKLLALSQTLFKTFSLTRWVLTVAENRRPYVEDWFGQYGMLMVYAFMLGSAVLFYDAVKKSKKAKYLVVAYLIFIFLYIFSRYSGNSIFNGESNISHLLFFGSLILFILTMLIYYFYAYYKEKEEFSALTTFDKKHTLMLVWAVVMILIATTAIRFLFEFTLVVVVLGAYFIISLTDYVLKSENKNLLLIISIIIILTFLINLLNLNTMVKILLFIVLTSTVVYFLYYKNNLKFAGYIILVLLLLILISPFSFAKGILVNYYSVSDATSKFAGPGYDTQWQYAGKWVRENTPENSVFAHWWDYGYWVQSGFQRQTVTDGGNFYGWWNYLMGRNVLTSIKDEDSLGYLYAHNATHLLIVGDEIGKYPAFSSIGSDQNGDRFSQIPTFTIDQNLMQKTRDGTLYYFRGGFGLDEDLKYGDKVLPRGAAVIGAVVIPVPNNNSIGQPKAVLMYNGQQFALSIKCLYLDKLYEFENYEYGACFKMLPVFNENNQANLFTAGLFLSPKVSESTVGRLYILNENSQIFELVYDDSSTRIPLSIYQGRMLGPIKIWKINYPDNFSLSEEKFNYYLRTSYPDQALLNPF